MNKQIATKKKAIESASQDELLSLREEFNLSSEEQELASLERRLETVDTNWKENIELTQFFHQRAAELNDKKLQDEKKHLDDLNNQQANDNQKKIDEQIRLDIALQDLRDQDFQREFDNLTRKSEVWRISAAIYDSIINELLFGREDITDNRLTGLNNQLIQAQQEVQNLKDGVETVQFTPLESAQERVESLESAIKKTTKAIKEQKEENSLLAKVWKTTANIILRALADVIKEEIANMLTRSALATSSQTAAVVAGTATGLALSAAYGPAATFASIMSFGGAAVAGEAGIVTALATTRALSAIPAEEGIIVPDIDSGIRFGTDRTLMALTPGEAVISKPVVERNPQIVTSLVNGEDSEVGGKATVIQNTIAPVFHIMAIDAAGVEDLVSSPAFQEKFIDLINDRRLDLKINDTNLIGKE